LISPATSCSYRPPTHSLRSLIRQIG
jgi:hypothetical protein